jgi:hypothetical protein
VPNSTVWAKFNRPVDRREKRNIFILFFFPRISTGPIKGPGDNLLINKNKSLERVGVMREHRDEDEL